MSVATAVSRRPISPADTIQKKCRICFQSEQVPITDTRPLRGKEPPHQTLAEQLTHLLGGQEREEEVPNDGFVSPCRCSGSMAWVHRRCLRIWRSKSPRRDSFYQCEQCFTPYHFRRTILSMLLSNRLSVLFFTAWMTLGTFVISVLLMTLFIPAYFPPLDSMGMTNPTQEATLMAMDGTFVTIETRGRWATKTVERRPDTIRIVATPPPMPPTPTRTTNQEKKERVRLEYLDFWSWLRSRTTNGLANSRWVNKVLDKGLLDLWPAALSFLAVISLLRDGSQFSCMTAMLILLCTVLLYMFGGTWPLYIVPLPLTYGLYEFLLSMYQFVDTGVDMFVKWTSSELDDYP
ncbi:hypothetical protein PSACC_00375 [Paramicrosporidium saccamoebae]|uniref:RING-CH-type domain-containing protein n=1 Tax=Paramicrosporidium saccamoebae TaxID=1246581 RepID=A0A2H9TQ85_9FUNG|nr:hypothetical protein PSACC_00375 [Paramicrosporidium saccamoebae]